MCGQLLLTYLHQEVENKGGGGEAGLKHICVKVKMDEKGKVQMACLLSCLEFNVKLF